MASPARRRSGRSPTPPASLKAFTPTEREWGVTDLARRLGIAKSTAHRLLATLTDEGLLEQDPATGRYRLGLVVFDLAAAAQSVDLHGRCSRR